MAYLIQVTNKAGVSKTLQLENSQKISLKSGDQVQITPGNNDILNTDNLVVIKKGNDLAIILENGQVLTLSNFYSYKTPNTLKFLNAKKEVETLLSSDAPSLTLGDDFYLVHSQGDSSILRSMVEENTLFLRCKLRVGSREFKYYV